MGEITKRRYIIAKKKRSRNEKGATVAGMDVITVQRLSSNVEGKCQKYSRIGPLTMVPLDEESTLENIKKACKSHFNTKLECYVLAGEGGPSFINKKHIQNWKVLHHKRILSLRPFRFSNTSSSYKSLLVYLGHFIIYKISGHIQAMNFTNFFMVSSVAE